MCCNKSRKSLSQELSFEVSLFRFDFVSALQYCHCEYPGKQTFSSYLKLPLKPGFLSVLLLFSERSIFACFKLIYFWISRPNPSIEKEMKEIKWISLSLLQQGYHNTNEKQLSSSVAKVTPDVKYKFSLLSNT